MRRTYLVSDLIPYINWIYFFHTWGVAAKFAGIAKVHACEACRHAWVKAFEPDDQTKAAEALRLYMEATRLLGRINSYTHIRCIVKLFEANSDGDDILLHHTPGPSDTFRLPMLRQQQPGTDGFCRSMADYIRPISSGQTDTIGIFATSVENPAKGNDGTQTSDEIQQLVMQTLCDRLAEAAAERLHEEVRKSLWGYTPDENLTFDDLFAERFQGIRPAIGYPSLPDLSINRLIDQLLDFRQIGVSLTANAMMQPHASVSGLMIAHPAAQYFSVGPISEEQLQDYARRRNMSAQELKPYLAPIC